MTQTAIIIPARYASTRFPGKPLAVIAGRTMIERVADIAVAACAQIPGTQFAVATEDQRIIDFCADKNIPAVITDDTCKTGTDRVAQAVKNLKWSPDIILGLQGDAPFTPLVAVTGVIQALRDTPHADVATPVVKLRWAELDRLRDNKKTTPFSGCTCVVDASNRALWFSKNIIPAMRKEKELRTQSEFSPVYQHLGLYGYRAAALQKFIALPEGVYEKLEGLEQLRVVEAGMHIQAVPLNIDLGLAQSGVDSPEDVIRAEDTIAKYGEPLRAVS
jgi:3-deoxy-manno-octulosonate cytidylyltransferase (CMP-KDO synthetase)